jgi:hypothetical protein
MANGGNFCVLNPYNNRLSGDSGSSKVTISNGNLKTEDQGSYYSNFVGTHAVSGTGKFYYEVKVVTAGNGSTRFGWLDLSTGVTNVAEASGQYPGSIAASWTSNNNTGGGSFDFSNNNSTGSTKFSSATNAGDVYCVGLDLSNGSFYISKNAALDPSSAATGSQSSGTLVPYTNLDGGLYAPSGGEQAGSDSFYNFGQDGSFGTGSGGGNTDANGFGDFAYAVPSDYLAICSGNLGVSSTIDPAQTDDDYSAKNFNVVTFSGNGSSNAVTGLGFKPDLIWGFTRDGSQSKRMIDSTRGGSSRMYSDLDSAEDTSTATISEFGTDGFTATGGAFNNDNGKACGAWCWKANGGTTSSNSSGTITSTVQANPAGGFSIITYTGSGSNATIGHGLSSKPKFFLVKDRARAGEYWAVYHSSLGATKYLTLNTNAAAVANSNRWNDTEPTDTLIGLGTNDNTNGSSTYLCYAWSEIKGYQHFGSYKGNGSVAGPFIYTGFRPRMVFLKRTSAGHNWVTFDTARNTFNPVNDYSNWDLGTADAQGASDRIEVLPNGFRVTGTGSSFNNSGSEFVYGAWGDVPFKYNNSL